MCYYCRDAEDGTSAELDALRMVEVLCGDAEDGGSGRDATDDADDNAAVLLLPPLLLWQLHAVRCRCLHIHATGTPPSTALGRWLMRAVKRTGVQSRRRLSTT